MLTFKKQSAYLLLKDKKTDDSTGIKRDKAREFLKKYVSQRFKDFDMVDFSRRYHSGRGSLLCSWGKRKTPKLWYNIVIDMQENSAQFIQ